MSVRSPSAMEFWKQQDQRANVGGSDVAPAQRPIVAPNRGVRGGLRAAPTHPPERPVVQAPAPPMLKPVAKEPAPPMLKPVAREPAPPMLKPVAKEPAPAMLKPVAKEPAPALLPPQSVSTPRVEPKPESSLAEPPLHRVPMHPLSGGGPQDGGPQAGGLPPELEQRLVGGDVQQLIKDGLLKELSGGLTKKVYKVQGSDHVLAVGHNETARQALRSEVTSLKQYAEGGVRSAAHVPMSNGEPLFGIQYNGAPAQAAVQPFLKGVMAQLKPKEVTQDNPGATGHIRATLDKWKKDWKPGDEASTAAYGQLLDTLHGDISTLAGHYAKHDMPDLQFFLDQEKGHATVFDPGDPSQMSVTTAQKAEVAKWPAEIARERDNLQRKLRRK